MQLDGKLTMVRSTYQDGSEQTTQTLLKKSPVSPSEGFKLVQKIVQTSRPVSAASAEKETEILVPDANGKLQTTFYQTVQEKK